MTIKSDAKNSMVTVRVLFHNCLPHEAAKILNDELSHIYGNNCVELRESVRTLRKELDKVTIKSIVIE